MESLVAVLGLASLATLVVGAISVVRPASRIAISDRRVAWIAVAGGVVGFLIAGALTPSDDHEGDISAASTTTVTVSSTTTVNSVSTSTTLSAPTTFTTSTTAASTTTTTTAAAPDGNGTLVLDLLAEIPVEREIQEGYDRDLFGVWSDLDGDGCDTRDEVLARDAVEVLEVSGCGVVAGRWYSTYDGVWLDHARQLEVDHVVALKEAWDSGARDWDNTQRTAFGNDLDSPLTLRAVSSASNQAKGGADPSNWLPDNPDDVCRYVAAWVVIKTEWALSMDQSEHGRIRNLLQGECAGTTVADAQVVPPTPPATTISTTASTAGGGSTSVVIARLVYDGPGNDVEYGDSEYVLLRNTGTDAADVGGWSLADEAGHVITIPAGYTIQPGGELRVYSGPGDNTPTAYYEGLGQAIWNNSGGDTATLKDTAGQVIDTHSYSS